MLLSKEEERELIKKAQYGDKLAIEELIKKNSGLVYRVARVYQRNNIDLEDLMSEGFLGMYKAILKFDLSKNTKFSTYAVYWIKSYIFSCIKNDSRNIGISNEQANLLFKMKKKRKELIYLLDREPTKFELAESLNVSLEELKWILLSEKEIISLNSPIQGGEVEEVIDFLESNELPILDKIILSQTEKEIIQILQKTEIANLSERDQKIFILLCRGKTLEEIGKISGVTRERVRQIVNKSQRILSKNSYIKEELCSKYPEYRKYKS